MVMRRAGSIISGIIGRESNVMQARRGKGSVSLGGTILMTPDVMSKSYRRRNIKAAVGGGVVIVRLGISRWFLGLGGFIFMKSICVIVLIFRVIGAVVHLGYMIKQFCQESPQLRNASAGVHAKLLLLRRVEILYRIKIRD
jgi:hypothetical protein